MLKINYLVSGGVITNYYCSSKCKHCVYASSPGWPKDYMTSSAADEIFSILKRLGCDAVHIGGGEPLLQPEKIYPVLESAARNHINIDYIETNASWFKDEPSAVLILRELMKRGVYCLLISIDPYHNEYIPFYKVKGLIKACSKVNMNVFPWLMDFWKDLDALDDTRPHSLDEYAKRFGEKYLRSLPERYGLNLRGRALKTYRPMMRKEPFEKIIKKSAPCNLLSGIYHFHVDLFGNFIPQACSGLSIKLSELVKGADPEKHPVFYRLETNGIKGLAEFAAEEYGYKPKSEYAGKCDLCYDIRSYLTLEKGLNLPDLQPANHYRFV
ncbi:MAG: radical SAM protein [Caldicoprobacterales bacterium]|jgi:MoaA/NifB/PqqE/SkfB family radical SAM enzyme|nr:radical SAM protein [Clostridiales bacterium]